MTGDTSRPDGSPKVSDAREVASAEAHFRRDGRLTAAATRALHVGERFGVVLLLGLVILFFSLDLPGIFPTTATFDNIINGQPAQLFVAFAALVTLIVGEFDLSIGYGVGLTSVLFAWLVGNQGFGFGAALATVLAAGLCAGAVNGFLVVHMRINSFIATLGTGTIMSGVVILLTQGQILSTNFPKALFTITQSTWFGVTSPMYYLAAVGVLLYCILQHTPVGRRMYAVGGNAEAARLTGIATRRIKFGSFVFGSLLWTVAGVINVGRIGAAYPDIGPEFLLPAFAAAFLGATTIRPGHFNVAGTVVASFLVVVGVTGFEEAGVATWVEPVFNGAVLLIAVGLSVKLADLRHRLR